MINTFYLNIFYLFIIINLNIIINQISNYKYRIFLFNDLKILFQKKMTIIKILFDIDIFFHIYIKYFLYMKIIIIISLNI